MSKRKTNEEFQEELQQLREQGHDVYTDDLYTGNKTKMDFYCSKGHKWKAIPSNVLRGKGCPYCSGRMAIVGKTSLWDKRPDVASLLADPEDGYKYGAMSNKKTGFICPFCNTFHIKTIANVSQYGFSCAACGDGISYPEKFMYNFLNQLKCNFKYQVTKSTPGFEWIENGYRYDFYVEGPNTNFFVGMDGGLGHGKRSLKSNKNDIDGIKRDHIKDEIALAHGIDVIRIDCDYSMDERFDYVKYSILKSDLSHIFDLSNIDWAMCDKYGQSKMVPMAAELYNSGLSVPEIKDILGCSKMTVYRWLKQACNIGLCEYSTKEARSRGIRATIKSSVPVNQYTMNDTYVDTYVSMADASRKNSVSAQHIWRACNNSNLSSGGFKWYRASDPNQPDKTKIISTIQN